MILTKLVLTDSKQGVIHSRLIRGKLDFNVETASHKSPPQFVIECYRNHPRVRELYSHPKSIPYINYKSYTYDIESEFIVLHLNKDTNIIPIGGKARIAVVESMFTETLKDFQKGKLGIEIVITKINDKEK